MPDRDDIRENLPPIVTPERLRRAGLPRPDSRRRGLECQSRGMWMLRRDSPALCSVDRGRRPEEWQRAFNAHMARAAALLELVPNAVLTGESAALFWGMPTPALTGVITLMRPRGAAACRRENTAVWRFEADPHEVITTVLMPVTEPWGPQTLIRVTSMRLTLLSVSTAWSLEDLVCAIDWMIRLPRPQLESRFEPWARLPDLERWAAGQRRRRGIVRLREAMSLARVGSDSPQETRLRLALRAAGLPEPSCNPLCKDSSGAVLGQPDLAFAEYLVGVEYHGWTHHDVASGERDIHKRQRFEAAGWLWIELTSRHAASGWQAAVVIVTQALRRRGWPGPPTTSTFR